MAKTITILDNSDKQQLLDVIEEVRSIAEGGGSSVSCEEQTDGLVLTIDENSYFFRYAEDGISPTIEKIEETLDHTILKITDVNGSHEVTILNGKDGTPYTLTDTDKTEIAQEVGNIITVPTKTGELTNNSGFITNAVSDLVNYYAKSESYTKDEVDGLISSIPKFSISVVSTLPTSDISTTTVYLKNGGSGEDLYTEYIYVNGKWEILGSQRVDLTGYAMESWVDVQLTSYLKQTALTEAINTALAQAKASGEFDGDDGVSPTITISAITGGNRIAITDANGTKNVDVMNGNEGDAGKGISTIARTSGNGAAGTTDTYTITYTDNTTSTFTVYNGKNGTNGADGTSVTHSWNGTTLTVTSASGTSSANLKGATGASGNDGQDGKSAYQSYRDLGGMLSESKWIESLKGKDGINGITQIEPLFAESTEWLEENGDISKAYICPDNFIYAYFETENTLSYTNLLPLADTTKRHSSDPTIASSAIKEGYIAGYRLSNTNGELKTDSLQNATGFIPITYGKNIYIKGATESTSASANVIGFYDSNYNYIGGNSNKKTDVLGTNLIVSGDLKTVKTSSFKLSNSASLTNCAYFRFSTGALDGAIVVVADTEPAWNAGSTGGYGWHNTGHAFVPANYEDRINELENRIENINIASTDGTIDTDYLRNWENAIYDGNIPTFETVKIKSNICDVSTNSRTPNNIYALYDDLMARYPQYIKKTDLGLCSDGIHYMYRYDIQAPETYHTGSLYSENKPKAFLMSGIHNEYIAVYGLFYGIEELVSNPDLRPLLRNIHLIVLPCANPYAMTQSTTGNLYLNANGVEIHRNFEVGFVDYKTFEKDGTTVLQYSGDAPLTEPESIAIDNIMKTNTDMAFVLSAHSFSKRTDGRVMWCSAGTKYTCNLASRVISKMSDSWNKRFSEDLVKADTYEGKYADTYGYVSISSTGGSEYRQATKYGIQGFNIEVSGDFVASTNADYKKDYSHFGISRYAEFYANVLLTAFGVYDYKDKDKYCRYIK